jgi:putative hemolysin
MPLSDLYIIIVALACAAFFAGMEIAFIAADRLQIAVKDNEGSLSAKLVAKFIKTPSTFIGTTLIGCTIAQVIYGITIATLLAPHLSSRLPQFINNDLVILICQTLISTVIVLATAEFLPKSIFLINPNAMIHFFALPMGFFYWLLYVPVYVVISLTKLTITHVFGFDYSEQNPAFGLTDINNYIQNQLVNKELEVKSDIDAKIFSNALDFKTVKVRECMIPRTELVAVNIADGLENLKQVFIESGHSKVLVYQQSIDDIIGYCHSTGLFSQPSEINAILNTIPVVSEMEHANKLLVQFIKERKSMAVVLDEFGGTSGIVTLEDIMEEIFGEINDEHDDDVALTEQKLDEHNFLLSARLEIDYINDKYQWNIPLGDYDTLGGYIISIKEDIPDTNDIINQPPFTFTIVSKDDVRLDKIKVTLFNQKDIEE